MFDECVYNLAGIESLSRSVYHSTVPSIPGVLVENVILCYCSESVFFDRHENTPFFIIQLRVESLHRDSLHRKSKRIAIVAFYHPSQASAGNKYGAHED